MKGVFVSGSYACVRDCVKGCISECVRGCIRIHTSVEGVSASVSDGSIRLVRLDT